MIKLRPVSFRTISLLVLFISVLWLRPCYAQALDFSLAPEFVLPGGEVIPIQPPDVSSKVITRTQRLEWYIENTVGPRSLITGVVSAGLGTGLNIPSRYGGTGEGFGRRYEMRLAGIATGNAMEATIGALWKEDPRYFRVPTLSFGRRVRNVMKMTFVAYRSDGNLAPAYARFIGITGSNLLANSWRASSEANFHDAALRTAAGFLGRMGSNAFQEFWPNVKPWLLHSKP